MEVDNFVLLNVENKQVVGITPSLAASEQVLVTVQSQAVYLYDVRIQPSIKIYLKLHVVNTGTKSKGNALPPSPETFYHPSLQISFQPY